MQNCSYLDYMSFPLDFGLLGAFCIFLFAWSLSNIKRKRIL
jgi:hypothetical protein